MEANDMVIVDRQTLAGLYSYSAAVNRETTDMLIADRQTLAGLYPYMNIGDHTRKPVGQWHAHSRINWWESTADAQQEYILVSYWYILHSYRVGGSWKNETPPTHNTPHIQTNHTRSLTHISVRSAQWHLELGWGGGGTFPPLWPQFRPQHVPDGQWEIRWWRFTLDGILLLAWSIRQHNTAALIHVVHPRWW